LRKKILRATLTRKIFNHGSQQSENENVDKTVHSVTEVGPS